MQHGRRLLLLAVGLLSFPFGIAAQAFEPGCALPFDAIKGEDLKIDAQCGIEGEGATEAKIAENRAKNNFCASGSAAPLTFLSFKKLQGKTDQMKADDVNFRQNRDLLKNIYKTSDGDTVGRGKPRQGGRSRAGGPSREPQERGRGGQLQSQGPPLERRSHRAGEDQERGRMHLHDETECEIREAYEGPEGLVEHRLHVGEALNRLFSEFADNHTVTVYGEPSPRLVEMAKRMPQGSVKWYSFLQGLGS